MANRAELDAEIDAVLGTLDGAELVRRLDAAGIANARQRELADVIDHPQLVERDRWARVDTPAGEVPRSGRRSTGPGSRRGWTRFPRPASTQHPCFRDCLSGSMRRGIDVGQVW